MPHPLAIKYGSGDPTTWDADKRAKARDELHGLLGAGPEGKKRLSGKDRVELMQIWLAIIAADHGGTAKAETPEKAAGAKTAAQRAPRAAFTMPVIPGLAPLRAILRTMTISDYVFVLFLCGVTISVFSLGFHAVREVLRMEEVKKDAEELTQWFKTTAEDRKNPDFSPAACGKTGSAMWKDCLAALLADGGPLAGKTNGFEPDRAMMSRKCDQQDTETIGTIVIEKGAIPVGSSSYAYTAFDGTEPVNKDMVLRILVCGRGFHLIKVQNELSW